VRKKVGRFWWSEEEDSDCSLNEDLHRTDSENHANVELGSTIYL
jgi:hypothetical protein